MKNKIIGVIGYYGFHAAVQSLVKSTETVILTPPLNESSKIEPILDYSNILDHNTKKEISIQYSFEINNIIEYDKSELVNGKDKRNHRRKTERKQKGKKKYGF